ncbi:hypothetical protein ACFY05_32340 [Microtetraspora fusca]|uniref:Uncharacterized protein n=1 Tax=Microtetraspora fusca TaxID=1997 RepID=A0ABW6VG48_MICFU
MGNPSVPTDADRAQAAFIVEQAYADDVISRTDHNDRRALIGLAVTQGHIDEALEGLEDYIAVPDGVQPPLPGFEALLEMAR